MQAPARWVLFCCQRTTDREGRAGWNISIGNMYPSVQVALFEDVTSMQFLVHATQSVFMRDGMAATYYHEARWQPFFPNQYPPPPAPPRPNNPPPPQPNNGGGGGGGGGGSSKHFQLINKWNGKALDRRGGAMQHGASICTAYPHPLQVFYFEGAPKNRKYIRVPGTNLCLDSGSADKDDNGVCIATKHPKQVFKIIPARTTGYVVLRNCASASGIKRDFKATSKENGGPVGKKAASPRHLENPKYLWEIRYV